MSDDRVKYPYRDNLLKMNKDEKPVWIEIDANNSRPPDDYTVTNVNQTHDFLKLGDISAAFHMNQNTKEWLQSHGIERTKLTLKDLLERGTVTKPTSDKTGKAIQHITFDASIINEFELKLNLALEMYSKRIKWLMQSSRKSFGLVQGDRVAILIDSSNANMGFGRAVELQDSLMNLITEQLIKRKQFYFAAFGTELNECWDDELKDVHPRSIEDAKVFVTKLRQIGGCNLLKALKRTIQVRNIDSLVIILGSVPDQNIDIISDFLCQAIINRPISIHLVSYELNNHIVNTGLKKLALDTDGRFHCFSNSQQQLLYQGTDVSLLLKEIHKVQSLLEKIKEMRFGMLGSAIVRIENEIQMELDKHPQGKFLPRPRGHDLPLNLEPIPSTANIKIEDSVSWVKNFGLKAKRLNLYQILFPNSYTPVEDFVPIIGKTVHSTVLERAMTKVTWHDGTSKNVHINFPELYEYQKQLSRVVRIFEKRIEWLSNGSRKLFGAVSENIVVILIDLSAANSKYLVHIQHSLRLLMEQQIRFKKLFNLIAFGSRIKKWRPTVVKPTNENLQDSWKWVLDLECEGTRNTLGALKETLENDEERKHKIDIEGIYLFTSGIPDQSVNVCCAYLEEAACGRFMRLNTILFNVDDYDENGAIPGRWANSTKTAETLRTLCHCVNNGRFHWFRETGIIESDDIKIIKKEIDSAFEFSKKTAELIGTFKQKRQENGEEQLRQASKLNIQRLQTKDPSDEIKALPWRPQSAQTSVSQKTTSTRAKSASLVKEKILKTRATTEPFYINGKSNSKGVMIKSYPKGKSVRKEVPVVAVSDKEEQITTKEWLNKYSLTKMKLDLYKLISGPDCKHETVTIGTLKKDVSARYCSIFPSINVNGTIKHLQLKHGELKTYADQCEKLLKRYIKRLQWLLSGSRRLFGTIVHTKVAILIDTSGSMNDYMTELKKELASLIWEQLYKQKISFNLIRYSNNVEKWREVIQESNEENCHRAIAWLSNLSAFGNTCTLDALAEAFHDININAIYLLTDGKPDNSTSMVLEEVRKLNAQRKLSINTISFNCDDKCANDFLTQLAIENNGRFHKSSKNDKDIHLFAHKILTEGVHDSYLANIPEFESDDLKRLAKEISKAKDYLKQAIRFNEVYETRSDLIDEAIIGPIRLNSIHEKDSRHRNCVPVDYIQ